MEANRAADIVGAVGNILQSGGRCSCTKLTLQRPAICPAAWEETANRFVFLREVNDVSCH